MNDYFIGVEFKGTFSDKDRELIKYYNLRITNCEVNKF